jgi:hypothetical protein
MSSRKLFSIFSNSYTITFSSFDHTIPVPAISLVFVIAGIAFKMALLNQGMK